MAKAVKEKIFEYTAVKVQQQPGSPAMYLLSIPASELLQWADVPNAKADYMAGYQRVYDPERASKITDFINSDPKNILPGAVIVSVNNGGVVVTDETNGSFKLTIKPVTRNFQQTLDYTRTQFISRLSKSEKASISKFLPTSEDQDDKEDGQDDAGIPESYLANLTAELNQFEKLSNERKEAIENYLKSVSKPALIIDGQHRVFGAKDVSSCPINLPVVLIPELPTSEQVFHFYVLNNKAKPLSATELRRTISTSLSNEEINNLWKRFEDAGIDPEATRWTHKLDTDKTSPFAGLIDFGFGKGFIKENVAYQVVSKFANMPKKYKALTKGIKAWEEGNDDRLDYFYAFWTGIKERYSDAWAEAVIAQNGQIFYKASMLVLQEYVLDCLLQQMHVRSMEGKGSILKDQDELNKYIKAILTALPPAFFTTIWTQKQIDTKPGHKIIRSAIESIISNQGKYITKNELFKKKP